MIFPPFLHLSGFSIQSETPRSSPDYRILYFSLQPRDIKMSAHCIFLHTILNRGIQYIQLHLTNPFQPSLIK